MRVQVAILSLLFVSAMTSSKAQDIETDYYPKKSKHELGVYYGLTTGSGVAYRYWPGRIGVQAVFLPTSNYRRPSFHSGITVLIRMTESRNLNLFSYLGGSLDYNQY